MNQTIASVRAGSIEIGNSTLPVLIAGPCVIESEDHAVKMAETIQRIAQHHGFQYIFKTSYDKANRTSIDSYRGPGLTRGLRILEKVKSITGLPVLTDIHATEQIRPVQEIADIIQIPAFLCRQTDLYIEAGKYNVPINVKKGQFMAPGDMSNVVAKARGAGVKGLTLTERGVSFGYNRLVVDFTSLPIMRSLGVPVVFDATHSLQLPGGGGTFSGGHSEYAPYLCRAAVAVGCDALFLEVHDNPGKALSDGANMVTPNMLNTILQEVRRIAESLRSGSHEEN